jgi:hypothetical protein
MLRQLSEILDKREKQKLVILLFGAIFMSFLGALGVAPIMPFILVAADPSAVLENEHLKPLFEVLSFVNEDNILLYMGCIKRIGIQMDDDKNYMGNSKHHGSPTTAKLLLQSL